MITLLASIAGFFSSIIPEILRILKDKNDKKHELDIFDRQLKFSKMKLDQQISQIDDKRDAQQQANIYATYNTGIHWIDAINGSVRPVLAYSFFIMYLGIKVLQYIALQEHNSNFSGDFLQYLNMLWTIDDQAIFAGIISFYFGQRTFSKSWNKR
jgi:hypothetical protein